VPYALYAEKTKSLGRTTVYLAGEITNAEAAQKLANEVGPNTESIIIVNTTALTSATIDGVTDLRNVIIENNSALQSVTINTVKSIYEQFSVIGCPNLLNLTLNNLEKAGGTIGIGNSNSNPNFAFAMPNLVKIDCFSMGMSAKNITLPSLTSITTLSNSGFSASQSINLSALTTIKGTGLSFRAAAIDVTSLTTASTVSFTGINLATLNLNALTSGNIGLSSTGLTQLTIPNLTIGGLHVTSNSALTQISVPNLVTFDAQNPGFNIENNSHLTQLSFPSVATIINYANILLRNNALPSTTVNGILHDLLDLTQSGYSPYINGQIPSAPPTGQGIIDKQTLIGQGNSIYTD